MKWFEPIIAIVAIFLVVFPIILMSYLSTGQLTEVSEISEMRNILIQNGWTWVTATCTMIFSLMHWPCSTTCLTIKKETGSWKWTALAIVIPTARDHFGHAAYSSLTFKQLEDETNRFARGFEKIGIKRGTITLS